MDLMNFILFLQRLEKNCVAVASSDVTRIAFKLECIKGVITDDQIYLWLTNNCNH